MNFSHRIYLRLLIFCSGLVTLGAELSASRLLAPYFGTSLIVWSSLIGLVLLALALGYWIGGKIADRYHSLSALVHILFLSGVTISLVPLMARPVLRWSLLGFSNYSPGILLGSLFGVITLLGLPMILLGCMMPFAVRLATDKVDHTGRMAGQLFALSTVGSVLGCFLPVLLLIPALGTRWTFICLGAVLLAASVPGYLLVRRRNGALMALLALLGMALAGWWLSRTPIKPGENVLHETESAYQYIRVVEKENGWRLLRLNEGIVTHSKYHPAAILTFGEWDYLTLAPFFNPAPYEVHRQARRWAIIGSAAGTAARLITRFYGPVHIDGIEIDPKVVETGREYFDMEADNFHVTVQDGRAWMQLTEDRYDVILVDAYRQPYIPFELSTREFFSQVVAHLNPSGVVAINVARPPGDFRLVNALATTIHSVFPSVFMIHLSDKNKTTIIVGANQPSGMDDFLANGKEETGLLQYLLKKAGEMVTTDYEHSLVLTDDRAPVERLMDLMILRALMEPSEDAPSG